MKKTWIITGIAIAALLAAYFLTGGSARESSNMPLPDRTGGDEAPATSTEQYADYGTKVVYGTDSQLDTSLFREHCSAQGGVFNDCGSPCPPEAEACVAVCAFTCESIPSR